jgi:hypothetical protein
MYCRDRGDRERVCVCVCVCVCLCVGVRWIAITHAHIICIHVRESIHTLAHIHTHTYTLASRMHIQRRVHTHIHMYIRTHTRAYTHERTQSHARKCTGQQPTRCDTTGHVDARYLYSALRCVRRCVRHNFRGLTTNQRPLMRLRSNQRLCLARHVIRSTSPARDRSLQAKSLLRSEFHPLNLGALISLHDDDRDDGSRSRTAVVASPEDVWFR